MYVEKYSLRSGDLPILLSLVSVILLNLLPPNNASCRTSAGTPICCRGRQPACSSYTYDKSLNQTLTSSQHSPTYRYLGSSSPSKRTTLKLCFCDEHCTRTMDCCPDYRELCHKPVTDCQVSEWGPWAECNRQCGPGLSIRRRKVIVPATNGGRHCPVLEESKPCKGYRCSSRRVGRSGTHMDPYMLQRRSEVAHLLPMRGDVLRLIRQWDMRWDVRRKLYLGRLIKQNKTEEPDPNPYCIIYNITHTNPACQKSDLEWSRSNQFNIPKPHYGYYSPSGRNGPTRYNTYQFNRYSSTNRNQYALRRRYRDVRNQRYARRKRAQSWPLTQWSRARNWNSDWRVDSPLSVGQRICVVCYPGYMREDLGGRCTGTGIMNVETRWRALQTSDCHGLFRRISSPQQTCNCGHDTSSFIFV